MTHICQRRDFASNWVTANPVLFDGEVGWEKDTQQAKVGDGSTPWTDLPYAIHGILVESVNGQMGNVVLDKSDVGLGDVDNTPDSTKPISTPQQEWVRGAIRGTVTNLGNRSGALNLSGLVTPNALLNGVITLTAVGHINISASDMPTVPAGTQFVMRLSQDAVGSRLLVLDGILKPGGSLVLSEDPVSVDLIVFFFDGVNWFATLSGKGFTA